MVSLSIWGDEIACREQLKSQYKLLRIFSSISSSRESSVSELPRSSVINDFIFFYSILYLHSFRNVWIIIFTQFESRISNLQTDMVMMTDKIPLPLFLVETIVRDPHHLESPNMLWAEFERVQNLSSGSVEWSCAVVITATPQRHSTLSLGTLPWKFVIILLS